MKSKTFVCLFPQVHTADGREAEVPSIVLVIPPPDSQCFDKAQR